jgi:hypothetical protein
MDVICYNFVPQLLSICRTKKWCRLTI